MKLELKYTGNIHVIDTNFEWTVTHRTIKHETKISHSQNINRFKKYNLTNLLKKL